MTVYVSNLRELAPRAYCLNQTGQSPQGALKTSGWAPGDLGRAEQLFPIPFLGQEVLVPLSHHGDSRFP